MGAAVTVSEAVSVSALKAVPPPLVVVSNFISGRAAGGVPGPVGDRRRFRVRAVGRVTEAGRFGEQEG